VSGSARRLGLAGFLAIAVAFGPARNGFGLFLPNLRREFGLSTEIAGLVAGGSYAGYLVSLSLVGLFAARFGPRLFVTIGGLSAALGMALVALASNAPFLAAGLVLAATHAGWSWSPYNDAVDREVSPRLRGRVLSAVSTGTTFGIVVAGLAALAAGTSWRVAWLAFAAAALATTAWNARVLPGGPHAPNGEESARRLGAGWFLRPGSATLFVAASSFGLVSGFYWSFAVDLISRSGILPPEAGPLFYAALGVAGFSGLLTGDAIDRFGLRPTLTAILASLGGAALLLGAAPASWTAVGVSAVLYGAGVMCMSALLSVWSSLLFPEQPSTGFSAALFLYGIGTIAGPVALGAFAGHLGLGAAFLVAGALALSTTPVAAFARTPEASSAKAANAPPEEPAPERGR
jgi:predicted MFS family arabinose efflux permease